MSRLILRLADCEVSQVVVTSAGVTVRLAAAFVQQETAGGDKPVDGFARAVALDLVGATLDEAPGSFIGRIAEGRVGIDGRWASGIALPSRVSAAVTLELAFANRSQLTLRAGAIECRFEGEANFAESLFC